VSGLNSFLMHEVELPLVPVLADMEDTGYAIDADHFDRLRGQLEPQRQQLVKEIEQVSWAGFNPASPGQVADLLFERLGLPVLKHTETGKPSVDEETLTSLKGKHEVVPHILRHRELTKVLSTYCAIPQKARAGRLHVEFKQLGAETGRLSSNSIIQTLPKNDEWCLRRGFTANTGCRIVAADFVQQEMFVLAAVSHDQSLQDAIKDNIDLHGLAAVKLFDLDCAPQEVKKLHPAKRDRAKAIQFGLIYGKGPSSLARDLGIPQEEATALLDDYFKAFPAVKAFIDDVHGRVARDGFVDDLFGRRRYLIDAQLTRPRKRYDRMSQAEKDIVRKINGAKRAAQNFVIQGAAATITKLAMIRCHRHLLTDHPDIRMILTLHDELHFDVPQAEVDHLAGELPDLMCHLGLERFNFHVPLAVEVKTGPTWGDLTPYPATERCRNEQSPSTHHGELPRAQLDHPGSDNGDAGQHAPAVALRDDRAPGVADAG
jgi:DNA polymerase I